MNIVSASAEARAGNEDGGRRFWTLLTCPACAGAIVIETTPTNSPPHHELLAIPTDDHLGSKVDHLPADVSQYYTDAIKVLRAGVPDAAAVQLRRTLEAAAAHYDVAERTLVASIEKLIADGHVTASFGRALHHIRLVGNVGAHHTDNRVDADSAERALRFTTALLQNLFEIPAELSRLDAGTESTTPPPSS
jgi:hypothetical protein